MTGKAVLAILVLSIAFTDAHHAGLASEHHEAADIALQSQELNSLSILDAARATRKSAMNPSDDKVALLATFKTAGLQYTNAAHASKADKIQEKTREDITDKAEDEHKEAHTANITHETEGVESEEGQSEDVNEPDPDDVRGRRRSLNRRMLLQVSQ